jgi:hypothetical protein
MCIWVAVVTIAPVAVAVQGGQRLARDPRSASRSEQEAFLVNAKIVSERPAYPGAKYSLRVTLDDGTVTRDAFAETVDEPFKWDFRFNVAAYELDKLLRLDLVPPAVYRSVNGRPAAVSWRVDVAMSELERRKRGIDAPDPERWSNDMQAVRLFDELIANDYRDISPEFELSTVWDNLLITSDWRMWLVDHTRTFRITTELEHPESLTRCDRALLRTLRGLNKEVFVQSLGKYLTAGQLDALEARRALLVQHFDEQIRKRGEDAVLYDLAPRR